RDKATNGVDDDGNGYLDDVHGWDFLGNNKSCYDGNATNQGEKHGTHVSGTIGAQGDNGIGVAGVNWNVTIICGKFLGGNGGTTADAIEAVDYFTDLRKNRGINVVATNNSWGGGGYSQSLYDAIERANTAGVLYIAAAGNGGNDGIGDNNDRTPHYPSSYTNANVVAVASTNNAGGRSTFSNYGLNSVDIGAPGTSIYSTLPSYLSTPYGSYSGTSMASPHVAGAAALYASVHPGASAAQIKAALLDTAIPTASIARDSNTPVATGGRLDANATLGGRTAPPMVLGVTVTTNKPAYSFGETATITVRVSDGVDAVSGATVSLSVRTPKGKTSTYSGTTNADGTASFPYTPMLKRDGAGTYTASGTASKTSYDGGTASTTFTFKR
ncbi:MAG: S8 family serine peptidase, partial [Chloroflexia bacterium]|nr:S8 family serine peptidase [Chloroflexia bacterium]